MQRLDINKLRAEDVLWSNCASCFLPLRPGCRVRFPLTERSLASIRPTTGGKNTLHTSAIPHQVVGWRPLLARPVLPPRLPLATLGPGCRASSSWTSPASGRQAPAETCLLGCRPAGWKGGAGDPRPPRLLRAAPGSEARRLPHPPGCFALRRPPCPTHNGSAPTVSHMSLGWQQFCRQCHSMHINMPEPVFPEHAAILNKPIASSCHASA